LRRELKSLQGNIEQANMKKKVGAKPMMRPMSSHPASRINQQPKENTLNTVSKDIIETE
jgi:hypothetical protein